MKYSVDIGDIALESGAISFFERRNLEVKNNEPNIQHSASMNIVEKRSLIETGISQ